jgi:hypothetical protein
MKGTQQQKIDKNYLVKVDDNYHYMDEGERYDAGSYPTLEEATKRCEEITIKSLKHLCEKGIDAGKLMAQWAMFGDDPFIVGGTEEAPFSARKFVSNELCSKVIKEVESNN